MGRGRAKAKQTKVARELKYSSGNTDLSKLQAELAGSSYRPPAAPAAVEDEDDDEALYAKYIEDEDDDE